VSDRAARPQLSQTTDALWRVKRDRIEQPGGAAGDAARCGHPTRRGRCRAARKRGFLLCVRHVADHLRLGGAAQDLAAGHEPDPAHEIDLSFPDYVYDDALYS
jgi:hypothetical protein